MCDSLRSRRTVLAMLYNTESILLIVYAHCHTFDLKTHNLSMLGRYMIGERRDLQAKVVGDVLAIANVVIG